MSNQFVQMIATSAVILPPSARSFDEKHAQSLARSIEASGDLFQPIGVIRVGDGYRLIWGRHRLGAYVLLGREKIPARILPPDTTPADELKFSMLENNLRRDESFEDTLARVEDLAKQLNCSVAKAAEMANVKPAYVSRCKTASTKLFPEPKEYAKEHKLGISLLHMVATKAATSQLQMAAFRALVAGKTREEVARSLSAKSSPKSQKVSLVVHTDEGQVRLTVSEDTDHDRLSLMLKQASKTLLANTNVPVRLLPQVLK